MKKKVEMGWNELSLREKDFLSKKKGELQDSFFDVFEKNKALRFYKSVSLDKLQKFNELHKKIRKKGK